MPSKSELNPTSRFSDRVEHYVKFRPGYPDAILICLEMECGLSPDSVIADVGSGTGVSTQLFLKNGNRVFGVEPNAAMRAAAEEFLASYPSFQSVAGTAENTTLPDRSVDFVVSAQAFHWFELDKARAEFKRILRPGGRVVLLWNDRRTHTTPFLRAYEALLLRYGTDYRTVDHRNVTPEILEDFFSEAGFVYRRFDNRQILDFEGLKGRVLSSSYMPSEGHPDYLPMLRELQTLFKAHQLDGRVEIEYDTRLYCGRLDT